MKELVTMQKTKTSQLHPREKETFASLCQKLQHRRGGKMEAYGSP
jgi:hypothetical protein